MKIDEVYIYIYRYYTSFLTFFPPKPSKPESWARHLPPIETSSRLFIRRYGGWQHDSGTQVSHPQWALSTGRPSADAELDWIEIDTEDIMGKPTLKGFPEIQICWFLQVFCTFQGMLNKSIT